jgi:hypothetical protein
MGLIAGSNVLAFSGAASVDWESSRADSSLQNGRDLDRCLAARAAWAGWAAALHKALQQEMLYERFREAPKG